MLRPHAWYMLYDWLPRPWEGGVGGISVALALFLPASPQRDVILAMTYIVVVFSIIVQGLSLGKLVRRIFPGGESARVPDE